MLGIRVTILLNGFANAGHGLGAVAGVVTGSVDQALEPRTSRQSLLVRKLALALDQILVQRLQSLRRRKSTGTRAEGLNSFAVALGAAVESGESIIKRRKINEW